MSLSSKTNSFWGVLAARKNRAGLYTRVRFFVKVCSCRKSHSRIAELGGGLVQTFVKIMLPCTRELNFYIFGLLPSKTRRKPPKCPLKSPKITPNPRQEFPRYVQEVPKSPPRAAKRIPRAAKSGPKAAQERPKAGPRATKRGK